MVVIVMAVCALVLLAVGLSDERHGVTKTHRGLEMKARNGRLVHVRQTESEQEL